MNLQVMLPLLILTSSSSVRPSLANHRDHVAQTATDLEARRAASASGSVLALLEAELTYSMKNLVAADGTRPYFIRYAVYDEQTAAVSATLGALTQSYQDNERNLNIDLRVGDYSLDNTHQIRGSGMPFESGSGNTSLALDGHPESTHHALWLATDRAFKDAVQRFDRIQTNLKVKVEEQDQSDDFSREEAVIHVDPPVQLEVDRSAWEARLRAVSAIARAFPLVYGSSVTFGTFAGTRYLIDSEGGRVQTTSRRCRITLTAASKAEDGMDLQHTVTLNAVAADRLPGTDAIKAAFRGAIDQVLALRQAPLAEPYSGPAILRNRASAVFFHEIFGHRIEGHRQRDVTEGQTFTKKIKEPILPEFISVFDDPTTARLGDIDLRGHYLFDDEGVAATRVVLVQNGILESFLMCRRPVEGFPHSNGHGRRQSGRAVAARQANLMIESSKQVPFERLREMLLEECRRQEKPYGLIFEDISGGFTTTSRRGAQMFKVLPIVVYRVYVDGRPDELIRGADIVGTPLASLENIICTADDPAVFNGSCGAESGWVPVSAVSPSILVSTIEIERRTHAQGRPPILDPPLGEKP